ncbi:MAG TPA: hypothetical protein VFM18_17425 [Methanosarcina sp.]|nr:hypothetical protein [Methanosarcina sp.]
MIKLKFNEYRLKLADAFVTKCWIEKRLSGQELDKVHKSLTAAGRLRECGFHGEFRDWLFKDGVMIILIDGEMYLQFLDEHECTKFMLAYL